MLFPKIGRHAGSGGGGQCKEGAVVPYKCSQCDRIQKQKHGKPCNEICKSCLRKLHKVKR